MVIFWNLPSQKRHFAMRFVCVDLETANSRMSSICQIGLVMFDGGYEVDAISTLIDPQDYFDGMNIGIHGITADHVADAPTFPDLHGWITENLQGTVAVCHSPFDRVAIARACEYHGKPSIPSVWLDTVRVARRAWPQRTAGCSLPVLAQEFGIVFQHHDALEDARAAGHILLRAMRDTGLDLDAWLARVEGTVSGEPAHKNFRRPAGLEGPLLGEVAVFTGSLKVARSTAADTAQAAGAAVENAVTKRTTLLIVGDQDLSKLAGKDKSDKHLKAEALKAKGQAIRIIAESDFMAIIEDRALYAADAM
jgi:DNA polymerase-3 subunit epsilon